MSESPVHRRLRHVRLGLKSDLDVVIDGLEHISLQLSIMNKKLPLMVDCIEYIGSVVERIEERARDER